jgi:Protein of unknown function (DUF3455)
MMPKIAQLAAVTGILGMFVALSGGRPQAAGRPEVPESLKAPAGEEVILSAHATGTQNYVCQAGADQKLSWVFKAPEADLADSKGNRVIHHTGGPTWRHFDGSEVKAKVVAKEDAQKPGAIPWLLLTATSHSGQGVLSRVTTIQRIHTDGGLAPEANSCNAAASGKEVDVPYTADYYFYGPKS